MRHYTRIYVDEIPTMKLTSIQCDICEATITHGLLILTHLFSLDPPFRSQAIQSYDLCPECFNTIISSCQTDEELPPGYVVLWPEDAKNIPAGWQIANGHHNTIDLSQIHPLDGYIWIQKKFPPVEARGAKNSPPVEARGAK